MQLSKGSWGGQTSAGFINLFVAENQEVTLFLFLDRSDTFWVSTLPSLLLTAEAGQTAP